MVRISLLLPVLCIAALRAAGQQSADTVLKGSTIEVIQAYKPQVKQAVKPEWIPQLPPADTTHPEFSYDVPQQTLYYTYNSLPLRPLALGKDNTKAPFPNYVKVGGGNLATIYFDAGIGGVKGANYETGINLHHISQKGKMAYQQSMLSGANLTGTFHGAKSDVEAGLGIERNQFNFYGGDVSFPVGGDSVKQVFTAIRGAVGLHNRPDTGTVLSYDPKVNVSYYGSRLDASELSFGFDAPLRYKMSTSLEGQLALLGAVTSYSAQGNSVMNNFAELQPGVNFRSGQVHGHALFGLAVGRGGKGYFLPDVVVAYTFPKTLFEISGGWSNTLRRNTYEQLTTDNPFLFTYNPVQQTKASEVFLNFHGKGGDHLSYSGRFSLWSFTSLATYLNDIGDLRKFYVQYMDVSAFSVSLGLRYAVANNLSVGATGEYYSFFNGTQQHAWHIPSVRVKGDMTVVVLSKLTVTANLALLGGMYAKDVNHNSVSMKMIADLGGGVEYQLMSRLSAFAQVNNILGSKYQRWYGYPVYGLNIYGGIRLKF